MTISFSRKTLFYGVSNRKLIRPSHRWEVNTEIDLTEMGCDDVDWIHLAYGKVQ
jgi:hypothetical protein